MLNRVLVHLALVAVSAGLVAAQEQRRSPHDSVSATLGGKKITITYGRPYLKGRKAVGGSLVPFGEVWRLGADEATKLTTEADIMIGDVKVPQGSYSLFTEAADADHWTLIINKTAEQWGAFNYKQSDDLGRTPLKVTKPSSPIEQFTISLKPQSASALQLILEWENTQATAAIHLP